MKRQFGKEKVVVNTEIQILHYWPRQNCLFSMKETEHVVILIIKMKNLRKVKSRMVQIEV